MQDTPRTLQAKNVITKTLATIIKEAKNFIFS